MKKKLRKMIGDKNFFRLRGLLLDSKYKRKPKINTKLKYEIYSIKDKHVFFGYYDIDQFSSDESKILVHCVDKKADPKVDKAQIGYFNLGDKSYHMLGNTDAWCWQQGSRLRWHPQKKNRVIFNDFNENHYVTSYIDTDILQRGIISESACYDISFDFKYGLSVNFDRLQRLRPGYGYSCMKDITIDQKHPENDGIFKVDLKTGTSELIITLDELASEINHDLLSDHYINHISISPDAKKFIFFHIIDQGFGKWKTRLIMCNMEDMSRIVLEDKYIVSHYTWKDENTLLVTCYGNDRQFYLIIDLNTNEKKLFLNGLLNADGHPSYFNESNTIITDTYPDDTSYQFLMEAKSNDFVNGSVMELASLWHSPYYIGEQRCDMHPRISKSNKYVAVDTLCFENKRSCLVFSLGE